MSCERSACHNKFCEAIIGLKIIDDKIIILLSLYCTAVCKMYVFVGNLYCLSDAHKSSLGALGLETDYFNWPLSINGIMVYCDRSHQSH